MAREMGMGVMPWSPLAGGVLTGKYAAKDLPGAAAATGDISVSRKTINQSTGRLTEETLEIAGVVKAVAGEMNRPPAQIALAWTLRHPAVASPIIGARTVEQLKDNLACLQIEFSDEQAARLDSASAIDPGFPQSMYEGKRGMQIMFGSVTIRTRA
jgi:aryl-alcohol dehydrogenase-like predicted oxidoreductase